MIRPFNLVKGSKVGIMAPARFVTPAELVAAKKLFQKWGFETVEPTYLYERFHQFSGTDAQRASDLQSLLDDPEVRAIFFARGGYGCLRYLHLLNWDGFMRSPKWLIGYSDITVFHAFVNSVLNVETLHATMATKYGEVSEDIINKIHTVLTGGQIEYLIDSHPLNRFGECATQIVGGNLSILYSLRGTKADVNSSNRALFVEDLDEYLYHIDRMMMNFKYGEKLDDIAALLIGGMSDMHDNQVPFGYNAEEIIAEAVHSYSFPLAFGIPAGHIANNFPLILGRKAQIVVNENGTKISYDK
jgi:muramoyltetrapeptide carboxypeptidase